MSKILMIFAFLTSSVAMADANCPTINGKFKCDGLVFEFVTTVNKDKVANHYEITVSNPLFNFKGMSDGVPRLKDSPSEISQYTRPYCAFSSLVLEDAYVANGFGHYVDTQTFTLNEGGKLVYEDIRYEQQGSLGTSLSIRNKGTCQSL